MSHRRARHSLILGCALAALAATANAQPASAQPANPPASAQPANAQPANAQPAAGGDALLEVTDIAVPAGWERLPEQSARITNELMAELVAEPPVPDLSFAAQARTWRGPDAGLVVTWLHATGPATSPARAARALLDHMRATPAGAALQPGDTRLVSWNEALAANVAEAELSWQHLANQTTTLSRALVMVTPDGRPRMVRADCVIPTLDQAPAARAACEGALDSLAPGVPAHQLGSLDALPPASPDAPVAAPAAAAPPPGQPASSAAPTPSLRAPGPGSDTVMILPPGEREDRSTPWLLLIGGAVLAAGLYFTLRGRAHGQRERDELGEQDQRDQHDEAAGARDQRDQDEAEHEPDGRGNDEERT